MAVTDLEIAPYLSVMVNKGGEDMYLHTGAKILFKGPGGFAWMVSMCRCCPASPISCPRARSRARCWKSLPARVA